MENGGTSLETWAIVAGLVANAFAVIGSAVYAVRVFTRVEERTESAHTRLDEHQQTIERVQESQLETARIQERTVTLIDRILEDIHAPEVGLRSRVHGIINRETERAEMLGGLKAQLAAVENRLNEARRQ